MKKFTLFASAALAASAAFAASPLTEANQGKVVMNNAKLSTFAKEAPVARQAQAASRAGVTPASLPTYRTFNAMYFGFSNDWHYYYRPFGFLPVGQVTFNALNEADSYAWKWLEFEGSSEVEKTATEADLTMNTTAYQQFEGPTLELTTADGVVSYNDSVAVYMCGANPAAYSENFEGYGLTPVKYTDDYFMAYYPSIDYTDKTGTNFNANGTYKNLGTRISSAYADCTDFKLTGWGSVVPGTSTPYLLKGGYILLSGETKSAVELTVTVMSMTDEGKINRQDTIGYGSIMLPAGKPQDFYSFEVHAASLIPGLTTDEPIVVPSNGVYLSISGINNPEVITAIEPVINGSACLNMDLNNYNDPIYNDLIDWNATLEFECTDPEGQAIRGLSTCTALFQLGDAADSPLTPLAEYMIFYDVEYPFISNATVGFEHNDMTIEIPVEGGTTNRFFECNQDIMQLIDDEYVTVDIEGADWLEYVLEPDEDYAGVFDFLVGADALPEGVKGRKATFTFTGYGYDNTITVYQGDLDAAEGSINQIVADKAKQGKVFDLQGRVVKNATKGIYIVDGVKTIL